MRAIRAIEAIGNTRIAMRALRDAQLLTRENIFGRGNAVRLLKRRDGRAALLRDAVQRVAALDNVRIGTAAAGWLTAGRFGRLHGRLLSAAGHIQGLTGAQEIRVQARIRRKQCLWGHAALARNSVEPFAGLDGVRVGTCAGRLSAGFRAGGRLHGWLSRFANRCRCGQKCRLDNNGRHIGAGRFERRWNQRGFIAGRRSRCLVSGQRDERRIVCGCLTAARRRDGTII